MNNLFSNIPADLPGELVETLLEGQKIHIERIVSQGHSSPDDLWYDQNQHEWVLVLKGSARLQFDEESIELMPGDYLNIPAHKRHRVEFTTPEESTIWLAIHYG